MIGIENVRGGSEGEAGMSGKIGIDPGHGGKDLGARGKNYHLLEKEVTRDIALRLEGLLIAAGYQVLITLRDDCYMSLQDRAETLNAAGVDLVVSIHVNSSANSELNYVSSHIAAGGGKDAEAAACIQSALARCLGWVDGGIRINNFYLLRETRAPSVLVEVGFISNPTQEMALSTAKTRELAARGLAAGIHAFFHPEGPALV